VVEPVVIENAVVEEGGAELPPIEAGPVAPPAGSSAAHAAAAQSSAARPSSKSKGAAAAGLAFLLLKAKSLLIFVKALPAAKFLLTSLSMIAMVAFEAQRAGVWFGVGFVLMILVHELGHGYAMKSAPRDRNAEAVIAYGGPLAGTAVSVLAAFLGLALDSRLFVALAYTGFFLNLFNLTPVSPLDGGRVAQAFSRRAWVVGIVVLGAVFLWTHSPQLLLIAALALPRLLGRASPDRRPALELSMQRTWAARYFGLAAFLGTALYVSGSLLGRS
jgi:Zn-dependent protease